MCQELKNQTSPGLHLMSNHISLYLLSLTLVWCKESSFLTLQSSSLSIIQPYWIYGHRQNVPFLEMLYFLLLCLSGRPHLIEASHLYDFTKVFRTQSTHPNILILSLQAPQNQGLVPGCAMILFLKNRWGENICKRYI